MAAGLRLLRHLRLIFIALWALFPHQGALAVRRPLFTRHLDGDSGPIPGELEARGGPEVAVEASPGAQFLRLSLASLKREDIAGHPLYGSALLEEARPKGRSSKSKSSRKSKSASSSKTKKVQRDSDSESAEHDGQGVELVVTEKASIASNISVWCSDAGIAMFVSGLKQEIIFGGEAMAQIMSHFCKDAKRAVGAEATERVIRMLSRVMELTHGAMFITALATPTEGGCDIPAKILGMSMPLQCTAQGKSIHLRIGGSAVLANGARASRQARPGFDVTYRLTDSESDNTPRLCTCQEMRKTYMDVTFSLMLVFDESEQLVHTFLSGVQLMDGLTGRHPWGDGTESTKQFALLHTGFCFRRALESPAEHHCMGTAVQEHYKGLEDEKLLVSWDIARDHLKVRGVLVCSYYMFSSLVVFARQEGLSGNFGPTKPLCQTPKASAKKIAEIGAEPPLEAGFTATMAQYIAGFRQAHTTTEPFEDERLTMFNDLSLD